MQKSAAGTQTACIAISPTFMKVGGSLGPLGTSSKNGPVTQRISTNAMKARSSAPAPAHHFTGTICLACTTTVGSAAAGCVRRPLAATATGDPPYI